MVCPSVKKKGNDMAIIYGYCRVSTQNQSIARQQQNILRLYPEAKIYSESFTGTTMQRPAWAKLIKRVKPGDVIVFDSVSRMSRTAAEGWETYEQLYNDGIDLEFIKEPHINTEVYKAALNKSVPMTGTAVDLILSGVNAYLMELAKNQIQIAFEQAEKEVQDLHQRTAEGMRASGAGEKIAEARQGKTYETSKSKQAKEAIKKYSKDFNGTLNDTDVIKLAGVSRNSYYKYKHELKAAEN